MKRRLSLIVPVYNVEKYLEDCIRSIFMQSFRDYELILVDDGSKDSSPQICDAYAQKDERVRVIHSPNGGVSHARNLGIEAARGEYLQFIDADDLLADGDVLQQMMAFTADPEIDLVSARTIHFPDGAPISGSAGPGKHEITADSKRVRWFVSDTMLMSCIYSKALIGDSRFDTRIKLGEDVLFLSQVVSKVQKAALLDKACYLRRLRTGSACHTPYTNGDLEQNILVSQLLYDNLHGKPGGDELYEKYYVDQTGLIGKLAETPGRYCREKRIVRKRIAEHFPHFLSNRIMGANTKLFLCAYMVSPGLFFFLYRQYKKATIT